MTPRAAREAAGTPAARLARFMSRYDPAIVKVARQARACLRRQLPGAYELVYDNYNALVIGYSPTEKTPDAVISIALYPRWVTLFFLRGVSLADPGGMLHGTGTQVRSIRLDTLATLRTAAVRALVAGARAQADPPLPASARGCLIIKSVSAKQRPRRTPASR